MMFALIGGIIVVKDLNSYYKFYCLKNYYSFCVEPINYKNMSIMNLDYDKKLIDFFAQIYFKLMLGVFELKM
jgi:hypothetical protein